MSVPEPRKIDPKLRIRERAHEALDELFDMYERGDPLWIVGEQAWSTPKHVDGVRIVISERY
jgi:hypothetical protein